MERWLKEAPPTALVDRMIQLSGGFRLPLVTASTTALRASEMWKLRWCDVRELEIHVQGKVNHSQRVVPLKKEVAEQLCIWREQTLYPGALDPVFASKRGVYLQYQKVVTRRYSKLHHLAVVSLGLDKESLPPPIWHGLRKYAVGRWLASGVPLATVKEWAGFGEGVN